MIAGCCEFIEFGTVRRRRDCSRVYSTISSTGVCVNENMVHLTPTPWPIQRCALQILLFTVNDTDCRILRRPPATADDSKRSATDGVATSSAHRAASGSIPRTARGKRGTSRSSSSRQRGRSGPAGASFLKSVSPSAAPARTKGRVPTMLGCRPDGHDMFVGNGSKVPGSIVGRAESRGDAGGAKESTVWGWDGGEGGLDGGPTLCSSVSTLSGEAF